VQRRDDELTAAEALYELAWLEFWAQRWELAADYAERAYELMTQYGLEVPWLHLPIAIVAAHRGRLGLARAHSERSLQLGEEQFGRHTPVHLGILGFVALQSGDPVEAERWFDEAETVTTRLGWRDAGHRWWVGDQVEASLALDRVEDAVQALDAWERERQPDDQWRAAHVTRCRGLVAAARGPSTTRLRSSSRPCHSTRRWEIASGTVARCSHSASSAGAPGRSARPARRSKPRSPASSSSAPRRGPRGLAPSWGGSAVARGSKGRPLPSGVSRRSSPRARTNREVAAALFLGERPVETHLSHVYAKLGVRSRAELARVYRPGSEAPGQSSGGLAVSS
jgi:Bacterial regulatory proteins, luxR family/Tetratricopeptide repeat